MRAAFKKLRKIRTPDTPDNTKKATLSPENRASSFPGSPGRSSPAPLSRSLKRGSTAPASRPTAKTTESAPAKVNETNQTSNAPPPYVLVSEYDTSDALPANQAFLQAIKRYELRLSEDERADFSSPIDVLMKVRAIDETHNEKSVSRRFAARIEKVLKGLNSYMDIVQTMVQHSPEISSLVVGGVMFILNLGIQFVAFFDKLTRMTETIEHHLSYLSVYAAQVFQKSEAVQEALARTYEDLLTFCRETRKVFLGKNGRMARQASFRIFLRNIWDPFEVTFSNIEKRFLDNAALVVREAQAQEILDSSLRRGEGRYRDALKARQEAEEKRATILAALGANDYEDIHRQMFAKRHGASGRWLVDADEYQNWISTPDPMLLWCYGNPGVGKTILASLVIEDLSQRFPISQETGVVFAYASYKDIESSQDPKRFLSTFILQLSRQREGLMPEVEAFYIANRKDARDPTFASFRDLFYQVLGHFRSLYIVLDALDEIEKRPEFLRFLTELIPEKDASNVGDCVTKIFITSRRERDIESRFSEARNIQIRASKVTADIDAYIRDELEKRIENDELQISGKEELKKKIFETLSRRADGMFLWVVYQLDHICNQSLLEGYQGVEDALDTLPETMDETYARVLVKIDRQRGTAPKLARKTLLWLCFARVPMALEELAIAIAIEEHHKTYSDVRIMPQPRVILEITGNLLAVNDSGQAQFVHYSAKEYLIRNDVERPRDLSDEEWKAVQRYRISEQEAHLQMFKSCFDFLLFPEFAKSVESKNGCIEWLKQSSFVGYAARWWNYHMESVTTELSAIPDAVEERLKKILAPGCKELHIITNIYLNMRAKFFNGWSLHNETSYYFTLTGTAFLSLLLGFPETKRILEEAGNPLIHDRPIQPIPMPDKDYRTMARWVCRQLSNIQSYEAFLSDPFLPHNLPTNLRIASSIRRRQFVEHLLAIGVSPNTPDTQGKYALSAVAAKRSTRGSDALEIMKLLLTHSANPNNPDPSYGPALLPAVRFAIEHPSYTQGLRMPSLLLSHGADANLTTPTHGHALTVACSISVSNTSTLADTTLISKLINLLLSSGANINLPCPVHGSALLATTTAAAAATAASNTAHRGLELTRLLLAHAADANLPATKQFGTVLAATVHAACTRGVRNGPAITIITTLLDAGTDINTLCPRFGSALIVAAASVSERRRGPGLDILHLLLKRSADVNLLHPVFGSAVGQAAVVAAMSQGRRVKAVRVLVEAGARAMVRRERGEEAGEGETQEGETQEGEREEVGSGAVMV
ncbi:hypothetical protein EX30DRAFT_366680 [Ascodesmis nigricans]|uniref:Uncharacterized protein n=1 Tax=Ascodesmis nigricans TaxID=341454 RepID=A0A4S2MK99_9PEZI|nr:hypothetical protein EX30DRAFT_366680 [Ascodesmis nigricans]